MRRTEEAEIVVDSGLPLVASARIADRFQIEITWRSDGRHWGQTELVDLAPDIFTFKIYAPLRDDRRLFESATVVDDGNAISWGDRSIDMPATAIERLAHDKMSSESLRAFMLAANLTRYGLAAQLGVSRRLVGYWLEGQAIPRYIMLACRALAGSAQH